ncbi:hypothetical protein [Bradyrhizobium sp.]|uniref:hypothetical protein n=1 Tax=Bradyrhizobium sp. TaxID=376 RepID=UPI0039E48AA2
MKLKIGLVAASLFGALAASPAATAMPIAPAPQVSAVEQVRWVCNPWGRCWWRPDYYGYYGPRYYAPPRYYYGGPRYYGPRYYGYRRW